MAKKDKKTFEEKEVSGSENELEISEETIEASKDEPVAKTPKAQTPLHGSFRFNNKFKK